MFMPTIRLLAFLAVLKSSAPRALATSAWPAMAIASRVNANRLQISSPIWCEATSVVPSLEAKAAAINSEERSAAVLINS